MKVGILTHYDVNNQGAQLQMYAMSDFLRQNGYDPIILTYVKNYDFNPIGKLRNQISIRSIPYIIKNFLFKKGLRLTLFNTKKFKLNKKFRKRNYQFANYAINDVDAIIIGSDEVLSLEQGANMMIYGHSCSTNNIILYAPSFGQTNYQKIKRFNCENLIVSGLQAISFLSARDAETKQLIETMTNRSVELVCDPVILHNLSQYSCKIKLAHKKYLLVYAYDKYFIDCNEVKAIKEYAKRNHLKTASIGTFHKWCDYNISCNCLQWLEYFKNAAAVITDTFHGTILSIISNKPVAVYIRNGHNNNKILSLLQQLDINKVLMNSVAVNEIERVYSDNIDYNDCNLKLDIIRKRSKEYLLTSLKSLEAQSECK